MAVARLSFLWDYDINEEEFARILSGKLTKGHLDRNWAAIRLLEYATYDDILHWLTFKELFEGWSVWRDKVRSSSRRRGFDFLMTWLKEHRQHLI